MADQEPTLQLKQKRVNRAVQRLTKGGQFRFTLRNLYYKMIRMGGWPQPLSRP